VVDHFYNALNQADSGHRVGESHIPSTRRLGQHSAGCKVDSKTILIVDDSHRITRRHRFPLAVSVITASDGADGINCSTRHSYGYQYAGHRWL
jgi:hypothetical protein